MSDDQKARSGHRHDDTAGCREQDAVASDLGLTLNSGDASIMRLHTSKTRAVA